MTALALTSRLSGGGQLTGTATLLRLGLRRDRIPLVAWTLGVCLVALSTFSTISALYPDEMSRQAIVAGVSSNPAFLVMTGPPFASSVGGLTAWRVGVIGALMVSLMSVFLVVRRTRADEEAGRTELLASGVVGRLAPLAAAVLLAGGASLSIGLIVGVGSIALGHPAGSSLALGAALAGPGLVFTGVAAVAAQVAEITRTASALAGATLGICYALRGIGDASPSVSWLVWLSPLGWTEKVEAFGADRWPVTLLFLVLAAAGVTAAVMLLRRRDIGRGILATSLGAATNPRMDTAFALARRLQLGSLIGWLAAFVAFGATSGTIATTAGDLIAGNPKMLEIMQQLGGTGALSNTMLAVMAGLAGLLAGVYAIGAALRMSTEEAAGRAAPVLAGAVGRIRWVAGHLAFVMVGPAVLLLIGGTVAGVSFGASGQETSFGVGFGRGLAAFAVQLPAVLVMGSAAVLLFGLLPRLTGLAWAALAAALLLGQLGALLQLPDWVLGISPFAHTPLVPSAPMDWWSAVVLSAIAIALSAIGVTGFRRRDLIA